MPLSPLKPQARVLRKQQGAFNATIKSTSPNAASGPRTHVKNHQSTTPQAAVIPQQPHTAPVNTKWSWKKWIMTLTGIIMTLVFALLTVSSMYKSERLAIWTAKSDFRDACRADRDHGMLSRACNDTLAYPALPPPEKRQMILGMIYVTGSSLQVDLLVECSSFILSLLALIVTSAKIILQRRKQGVNHDIESEAVPSGSLFER